METVALWNDLSPGRAWRLFAAGVLCALVALTGALLLAAKEAHANESGDATGGGANQLNSAAGGGAQNSGNAGGGGINQNGGGQALGDAAGGGSNGLGSGSSGGGAQGGLGAAANGGAWGSGGSGYGGQSLAPGTSGAAPAPNGSAPVTTSALAPAQVYEAAPVPAATNGIPAPVGQVAQPAVETVAPVAGSVAGTPETMIEPVRQAAEPVREVARPIVGQANGAVEPAVERVAGAAEPVRRAVKPVTEPRVRGIEPVTRPAVEPGVRAARLGGTPEVGRPAGARLGSAEPDATPARERVMAARDLLVRPELAAVSPMAREAAVLPSATLANPENTVSRFAAAVAVSSSGLSDLHGFLDRAVAVGERFAVGVGSAGGASGQTQPSPVNGVPASVGISGGLGAGGSGVGGAGLAVLALLLYLLRAGGSLSWLSFDLLRPDSAFMAITERPG